ncbi:MAG: hypothetical protein ABSA72_06565 [Nitrososphaerales archaeon]|jgi:hypothetical protein
MTLTIEIAIECLGEREAASLEAALTPDNHPLPKGQRFSSTRIGSVLSFRITSDRQSSCISSAISLLTDARLFDEVWSAAS